MYKTRNTCDMHKVPVQVDLVWLYDNAGDKMDLV